MAFRRFETNGAVGIEAGASLPDASRAPVGAGGPATEGVGDGGVDSFDAELDRLYLCFKVQRGLEQAAAGDAVSHEEAKQYLAKWLS